MIKLASRELLGKVALPCKKGFYYFKITDIVYFQSEGNFCLCYFTNGTKHLINLLLKDVEGRLVKQCFCRIHHVYLINLYHLEQFKKEGGNYVHLSGGIELPVSRAKKNSLIKMVGI